MTKVCLLPHPMYGSADGLGGYRLVALTLLPGNGPNRTSNLTPLLRSFALSALLTASALAVALPRASAQETVNVGNTVSASRSSLASVRAAAPTKRRRSSRSSRGPLSSRGSYNRAQDTGLPALRPKTLTGRVAVVLVGQATMRRECNADSRVLSKVPQGTNLALVYEAGSFYGVLMSDSSVGWVAKSSVQMIDYQVSITPPPGSALAAATTTTEAGDEAPTVDGSELPPTLDAPPTNVNLSDSMSPRVYALLQEAFTYRGVPYVWGGVTRSGLDCSAFVGNVFRSQGISLPRVAADQAKVGQLVNWADLAPGDRLYFDMGRKGRVSHTGLYIGNGYFIHASTNHHQVDVDPLSKPNYLKALVCARRSL